MTIDDKKCGTCKYFHPWYWNEARGQCHFPVPEWLMLLVKNLSARFDYVPDQGDLLKMFEKFLTLAVEKFNN